MQKLVGTRLDLNVWAKIRKTSRRKNMGEKS